MSIQRRNIRNEVGLTEALVITSYSIHYTKLYEEKLLALGCADYLSKPFDPADLLEMVRKWLQ